MLTAAGGVTPALSTIKTYLRILTIPIWGYQQHLLTCLPTCRLHGPTPKQAIFHKELYRYRGYGGSYKGGKTAALANEVIRLALTYPGTQILVGRNHFDDLRHNTTQEVLKFLPPQKKEGDYWRYSSHYNELLFTRKGSWVKFESLERWTDLKGPEYGAVAIDEADEVSEEAAVTLNSRLCLTDETRLYRIRQAGLTPDKAGWEPGELLDPQTGARHIPYYFLAAFNPRPGHWIQKWFYDDAEIVEINGILCYRKPDMIFIPALPWDNPHIPSDYAEQQLRLMSPADAQRYIYGQWTSFEDAYLPQFNTAVNVIEPFEIPSEWPRYRALDHGASEGSGTACLWAAVAYPYVFIYKEYLRFKTPIVENVAAIKALYPEEKYVATFIDPSTQRGKGIGLTIKDQYWWEGMATQPVNNSTDASGNLLNSLFRVDLNLQHPRLGTVGSPRLFIFNTCKETIRQVINASWKRTRAGVVTGELPRTAGDLLDALRYMGMGLGLGTTERPRVSYKIVRA